MEQDLWKMLQERSVELVLELLSNPTPTQVELKRAELAVSALASYTQHEATEESRERMAMVAGRMLAHETKLLNPV